MTQITGGRKRKRGKKKRSPSPVQNCFVDFDPSGESVASIAVRTACSRYRGEWHYKGQSVARNVFATTTIKRTTALFSKLELSDIRWGYRGRAHRWVSKPGRLISSRVHRARAPPLPPATRSSRYVTIFQLRVANNSSSWPPNFEKMRGGKGGSILISRVVIVEGVDSLKLKRGRRMECKFMNGQSYREWED